MIPIVEVNQIAPEDLLTRDIQSEEDINAIVDTILSEVRQRGDAALRDYTLRFDSVYLEEENFQVTELEIVNAWNRVDTNFRRTLLQATENIRRFHERQVQNSFVLADRPGVIIGQRYLPIEKVGICIPRSPEAFPSTILMNVIPAKLAGVREIILVTPPRKDGTVSPEALVAAKIAGAGSIFKVGGAQAVAALAFGTERIPRVDKIVGPGGIFVAAAKRKVFGQVDIDMIAGPSEIVILADKHANPRWVAADLLSQAEHDIRASAVLITDSLPLARAVQGELEVQFKTLPRREIAWRSIEDNGRIFVTSNLEEALDAVNSIAPEHLELCVENPFEWLPSVKNAGSIFLGYHAPEALGDYFAGPNHTLPTSGTARFSSPLGVDDFRKRSSFLYYTKNALASCAERVADFARREGLEAHARSVLSRGQDQRQRQLQNQIQSQIQSQVSGSRTKPSTKSLPETTEEWEAWKDFEGES